MAKTLTMRGQSMAKVLLHTLVRSISTSHHISYVRQLTTTISLITTLFPFMFQFTSQFILSSLRKHLSSIAHCRHFPVNYKRLLSSFWIVLTYVSRDSTIVCKEGFFTRFFLVNSTQELSTHFFFMKKLLICGRWRYF